MNNDNESTDICQYTTSRARSPRACRSVPLCDALTHAAALWRAEPSPMSPPHASAHKAQATDMTQDHQSDKYMYDRHRTAYLGRNALGEARPTPPPTAAPSTPISTPKRRSNSAHRWLRGRCASQLCLSASHMRPPAAAGRLQPQTRGWDTCSLI